MSNEPIPPLYWRYESEDLVAMSDVELVAHLYDQIDTEEEEGLAERTAQLEAEIEKRGMTPEHQRAILPPFQYIVDHG
jgi:hypothetical protein